MRLPSEVAARHAEWEMWRSPNGFRYTDADGLEWHVTGDALDMDGEDVPFGEPEIGHCRVWCPLWCETPFGGLKCWEAAYGY